MTLISQVMPPTVVLTGYSKEDVWLGSVEGACSEHAYVIGTCSLANNFIYLLYFQLVECSP